MAKKNQAAAAPPNANRFAGAQGRMDALNAKIAAGGGDPTRKQQRALNVLQNRANQFAAANPNQPINTPATLPGIQQGNMNIAATGNEYAQNLLANGGFQNPFTYDLSPRIGQDNLNNFRQSAFDTQYGYLTRDLGQQEAQAGQDIGQSLTDRGITYSADPNSRYQQEMRDYTNRFDRARADARAQADQFAGQEMQRMFGINEQTRANQMNEQGGQWNQRLSDIAGFSNLGIPNVMGFEQLTDQDKALRKQWKIAQLQKGGSGGGGGGGTAQPAGPNHSNPFTGL